MIIDSHCHLEMEQYKEDLKEVIERMTDSNVARIINVGESMKGSKQSILLAQKYPTQIVASIGIHPHNIEEVTKENLIELEKLGQSKEVVAIGEIGLDYYRPNAVLPFPENEKAKQKIAFIEQLHLAAKLNKPVIIHSRDAYEDTVQVLAEFREEMMGKYELRGVVHSWAGNIKQAQMFFNLGLIIGFTGNITYPNISESVEKVIEEVPLSKMLVETDAPFLAPQIYRGTRNEPAYVWEVASQIAIKKGINIEEVADTTSENAKKLFNLS